MEKEKPRLARLAAILTQLQSKRMLTAREIAEKHQVSIRTVYRDMRTLEKSGVPILMEEGKGYTLMEGYKIPPIMFTEEEAHALITAQQLILKNKDQSLSERYESALLKILSVLKYTQKDKADLLAHRIQVRTNPDNEKSSHFLMQIQSCIANYQLMHMVYHSLENEQSEREIEPFAIYTTQDNWVLIAYCRLRKDFRAFRLDCIQQLQTREVYFEPHPMTLQEYLEKCRGKYTDTPDIPLA